jgi:hypothetical protein
MNPEFAATTPSTSSTATPATPSATPTPATPPHGLLRDSGLSLVCFAGEGKGVVWEERVEKGPDLPGFEDASQRKNPKNPVDLENPIGNEDDTQGSESGLFGRVKALFGKGFSTRNDRVVDKKEDKEQEEDERRVLVVKKPPRLNSGSKKKPPLCLQQVAPPGDEPQMDEEDEKSPSGRTNALQGGTSSPTGHSKIPCGEKPQSKGQGTTNSPRPMQFSSYQASENVKSAILKAEKAQVGTRNPMESSALMILEDLPPESQGTVIAGGEKNIELQFVDPPCLPFAWKSPLGKSPMSDGFDSVLEQKFKEFLMSGGFEAEIGANSSGNPHPVLSIVGNPVWENDGMGAQRFQEQSFEIPTVNSEAAPKNGSKSLSPTSLRGPEPIPSWKKALGAAESICLGAEENCGQKLRSYAQLTSTGVTPKLGSCPLGSSSDPIEIEGVKNSPPLTADFGRSTFGQGQGAAQKPAKWRHGSRGRSLGDASDVASNMQEQKRLEWDDPLSLALIEIRKSDLLMHTENFFEHLCQGHLNANELQIYEFLPLRAKSDPKFCSWLQKKMCVDYTLGNEFAKLIGGGGKSQIPPLLPCDDPRFHQSRGCW